MSIQKMENLINLLSILSIEEVKFFKSRFNSKIIKNNNIEFFVINSCTYFRLIKFLNHNEKNNEQRYICCSCEKIFTATTLSILNYLHKSNFNKFKKSVECAINNLSLIKIISIWNIFFLCAFNWSLKKIDYLINKQQSNKFISELTEIDKIYFGNSKKRYFKNEIRKKQEVWLRSTSRKFC